MVTMVKRSPFQFTQTPRVCPQCRARLVMVGRRADFQGSGLMGRLGVPCHCVACNTKYRAQGQWTGRWLWWMMPPVAWWVWWAAADVTPVTTVTSDSSFLDSA